MNFVFLIIYLLIFSILNFCILKKLHPKLRILLPDIPNHRSSHESPTPTGGGISFVILSLVSSLIAINSENSSIITLLPIFCIPLAILGLIDDFFDLNRLFRYVAQLITSIIIVYNSVLFYLDSDLDSSIRFLLLILLIFLCTSIINFVNFMDGIDGLVGGCLCLSILTLAISLDLPTNYYAITGSLLGFLILNWHPAKVFMGDVGSTFLGALYAGLCLNSESYLQTLGHLLILFPLLCDAFICVVRRFFNKENIFEPHTKHLYQRLYKAGYSHASISSIYILMTLINSIFYLYFNLDYLFYLCMIEFIVGIYLDQRKSIPFRVV